MSFDTSPDVNDTFAAYFKALGYGVTYEGLRATGERWHEIYDDNGIICQVSFGTPLAEFLVDLPYLVEDKLGIGPTNYWCACKDSKRLRGLLALSIGDEGSQLVALSRRQMTRAKEMKKTERTMSRVMAPVIANCELCKLSAAPGFETPSVAFQLDVMYGGKIYADEGNELVALWRRPWLCEPCLKVIHEAWTKSTRFSTEP